MDARTRRASRRISRSWRRCDSTRRTVPGWPTRLGFRPPPPRSSRAWSRSCVLRPPRPPCAGSERAGAGVRGERGGGRSRHELFDAVVRLLLPAAEAQRLLLILDDLHRADVPTLLLLRQLIRRGAGSPLLVLVTYSDLDTEAGNRLSHVLVELKREAGLETIRLDGLGGAEVAALAAAQLGRESIDGASTQRLLEQTGGNPFFIEELLHTPSAAPTPRLAVPEGVKDVIGRRLDRLAPETRATMTLAAVLGTDFRRDALRAVAVDQRQDDL